MHVVTGEIESTKVYRTYLESKGDVVIDVPIQQINLHNLSFDLGFICCEQENIIKSIELLASKCKVLVIPKLKTVNAWDVVGKSWPGCQFVMAKPNLYRPQIELLRDIRLMRDVIDHIAIYWNDIIGMIHIAHVIAGPLSKPSINGDVMVFENFGIKTYCKETVTNNVTIEFKDGSITTHAFVNQSDFADHKMIQDLFKLTKFNPGEFHKHHILDKFVHRLLE